MKNKDFDVSIDGLKKNILKDWRLNPLTTAQRVALGSTLDSTHSGIPVYDTDEEKPYFWTGTQWKEAGSTPVTPGAETIDLTAGESISSGMAVIISTDGKAYKYDIIDESHAGLTCGIAKTSGVLNTTMTITLPGHVHIEASSGWLAGVNYYVASNSLLTTISPTTGIVKHIGTGIDTDTIFITNYNELILL